ncbi:MAG: hypothetical protein MN733_35345 [Nitrososphaera sp.]|nr:hypothetical protein [Nitrososphaera sp.]
MLFKEFAANLQSIALGKRAGEGIEEKLAHLLRMQEESELAAAVYLCQGRWDLPYTSPEPERTRRSIEEVSASLAYQTRVRQTSRPVIDNLSVGNVYQFLNQNSLPIRRWLRKEIQTPPEMPLAVERTSRKWLVYILQRAIMKDETIVAALALLRPPDEQPKLIKQIRSIYSLILPDLGTIAQTIIIGGVSAVKELLPAPGIPFKPQRLKDWLTIQEAWDAVGSDPFYVQPKYRGEEIQIHFTEHGVHLFDRRLQDVTNTFSDIARECRRWNLPARTVLDSEVVGVDTTGAYLPESQTQSARYHIAYVFDLMFLDGVNWCRRPFHKRKERLSQLVAALPQGTKVHLAHDDLVDSRDELERLYLYWVKEKYFEGIVIKKRQGYYKPGNKTSRDKGRVKEYVTLDVVVVGYNPTSSWRVTFLVALWNKNRTRLTQVRMVESVQGGESATKKLMEHFVLHRSHNRPSIVEPGVEPKCWVEPNTVVEVRAEGFKLASTRYAKAGYTLDGGVVICRLRQDKDLMDADTLERLWSLPEAPRN